MIPTLLNGAVAVNNMDITHFFITCKINTITLNTKIQLKLRLPRNSTKIKKKNKNDQTNNKQNKVILYNLILPLTKRIGTSNPSPISKNEIE